MLKALAYGCLLYTSPVSGLVIFAKTSKALTRLNEMFRTSEVKKTYWAVVKNAPKEPEEMCIRDRGSYGPGVCSLWENDLLIGR